MNSYKTVKDDDGFKWTLDRTTQVDIETKEGLQDHGG